MRKQTTKVCQCGNTVLALLPSLNKKYCPSCHTYIDWYLSEGQKSPLTSNIGGQTELNPSDVSKIDEIEIKKLSAENTMRNTEPYCIPLLGVSIPKLATFFEAFEAYFSVKVPDELLEVVGTMLPVETPNVYLIVTVEPLSVTMATLDKPMELVIPIDVVTSMYTKAAMLRNVLDVLAQMAEPVDIQEVAPQEEEPVVAEPVIPQGALNNRLTVEQAALEYKEVWYLISSAMGRVGMIVPTDSRIANVKNMLAVFESAFAGVDGKNFIH